MYNKSPSFAESLIFLVALKVENFGNVPIRDQEYIDHSSNLTHWIPFHFVKHIFCTVQTLRYLGHHIVKGLEAIGMSSDWASPCLSLTVALPPEMNGSRCSLKVQAMQDDPTASPSKKLPPHHPGDANARATIGVSNANPGTNLHRSLIK